MQNRHIQKGMTLSNLLFVLGVVGFLLFLGFRLIPPYADDFKVQSALDSLEKQPDIGSLSRAAIVDTLRKRFEIDDIRQADPARDLTLEARGRTRIIRLRYKVTIPLIYNISALLEFQHAREVRGVE